MSDYTYCSVCGGFHPNLTGACQIPPTVNMALVVVKCPVCDGSGLVSRPPHVAGDQPSWVDSGIGPYPCKRCAGVGTLTLRDT